MLLWLGLGVLVATLAVRLRWKTPGLMTAIGVLLGLHLIVADVAPTERRSPILAMSLFWAGLWIMVLLAVALRPLVTKQPPR